MTRVVKLSLVAVAVVATATLAFTGSCGSNTLPPALSARDRRDIASTHFALSVGVEPYKYPVYSQHLIETLRATKLFDRVDELSRFSTPPALIARVEYPIYGSPIFPIRTFVSAGILSTTVQEQHGHAFSLRSARCQDFMVPIEFKYTGETTLGWWAVLLNLQPDHTKHDPEKHFLFRDNLAARIVREKGALAAMLRQRC